MRRRYPASGAGLPEADDVAGDESGAIVHSR